MSDELNIDPDSPSGEEALNAAATGELENLRTEKNALFEKLARAQADFSNSRKRLEADLETRVQYQLSKMIESQLPVIDNFELSLGIDPSKTDAATILKGMKMVHDQWIELLKKFGVELIAPKPGEAFNPHFHQAIMHEPSEQPAGTIARTAQTGYSLNGKLIRSALVVVAK
jgi:molecular chaperone GrpE